MDKAQAFRREQTGYLLIETLISVLIFSIAMLGIVAMYATSVRNNTEAKYRADASFLVDEVIAKMRVDDRRPTVLKTNYEGGSGTDGAKYTSWVADIVNNSRLPGVPANPPTITIRTLDGFSPPTTSKSLVTVTVRWQLPNTSVVHNHVVTTGIQ